MSGGAYDYAFHHVMDMADTLETDRADDYGDGRTSRELRLAFREHLRLVAQAIKAIEWNDSGDGASDEGELIRKCLGSGE